MKKLLIICLCVSFINCMISQTYFNKFYGRPEQNQYLCYATTKGIQISSKRFQILYQITNTSINSTHFNIATLNENGDTILNKSYIKSTASYFIYSVIQSKNGFIYYGGDVFDSTTKKQYYVLIKVNQLGDTIWTKKYGLQFNDGVCDVMIQTSDQGFILAGWTANGNSYSEAQVIKVDSSGNLQWSKYYGGARTSEIIYSCVETPQKDIIFVGTKDVYYSGPPFVDFQYYMFKTDSLGNLLWEKTYGNEDWLEVYSNIIKTKDNNYLIGGGVNYTPNSNENGPLQLTKINSNGDTLWRKDYLKNSFDSFTDLIEIGEGNIVFTGWAYNYTPRDQAAGFLYKVNAQGDSLWVRIIDSDTLHDDYINHLSQTSDKGFILTGAGFPPGRNRAEAWIIKVDSLGCTYEGCARTTPTQDITEGGKHMTLYPNPASDFLHIDLKSLDFIQEARLVVVDILGRRVKDVKLEKLTPQYSLDIQGVPNGTYFCTLLSNQRIVEVQKFVIVK